MRRRYRNQRDDFSRPQSYRAWLEETYLAPVQEIKQRSPVAYTLLLGLAIIVFLFVCSVPCLILGRFALRLIMGA
jgi:hypothetical protein